MDKVELFENKATNHFAQAVADRLAFLGYNVATVVSKVSFKGPSVGNFEEEENYKSDARDILEHGFLRGYYQGYNVEWNIGLPDSYYSVTVQCRKIHWFDSLQIDHWKMSVPEMDIYSDSRDRIEDFYQSIPQLRKEIDEAIKSVHKKMDALYSGSYESTPAPIEDPENEIEKFSNMLREMLLSYTKDGN